MKLSEGIELYVAQKRMAGISYLKAESAFSAFCRQMGDVPLRDVTTHDLMMYLDGLTVSSPTWHVKYLLLFRFFQYWAAQGAIPMLHMPPKRVRIRSNYLPHVYTRSQLRTLLDATTKSQSVPCCDIDAKAFRMIILMLYATGATIGEVLGLRQQDISLRKRCVNVRNQYIAGSREVPIGIDLCRVLREFLRWRFANRTVDKQVFGRMSGKVLTANLVSHNFGRLRKIGGVSRNDGVTSCPRLQDLRATFAVHRISSWIANGDDLNVMLPALAAYMGQVGLGSTERYLSLTPDRFRKQLDTLSPKRGRKHWRDDPTLIAFLSAV